MTDYATFTVGAVSFPLTAALTNSALQDADPALYQAISFWQAILEIHLGDRWDAEVSACGLAALAGKVVASVAPYDPVPEFQEAQFALPLLAAYRMSAQYSERTVAKPQEVSRWGLDWILPPLTVAQKERLYPFLAAAAKALHQRTDFGMDPANESGRLVWADAGVSAMWTKTGQTTWLVPRGPGANGNSSSVNTAFPLLHMEFEVHEERVFEPGEFPPLARLDATISNTNEDAGAQPVTIAGVQVTTT